ncbi:MAG: hypothetical protein A2137_00670 [Chloroflexi bacterium RBG_16_58_8]|nr:MAG: hypothetical protein A2137_00670 [Chloroflexi bacterium RBG_16_58_8]
MLNEVRKRLAAIVKNEAGQTLPIVLAMMTLGSLLVVNTLNYVSTNVKTIRMVETKARSLYAAEAGVEDALWKIKYDTPPSLPYAYSAGTINGMTVTVSINNVTEIAGVEIGPTGVHEGWLKVTKSVSYSGGVYTFNLSIRNDGAGNMKIEQVLVDFGPDLVYVEGSVTSNLTSDDPTVIGIPDSGITLLWDIPSPFFTMGVHQTEGFSFQLSGPELPEIESHAMLRASREDVGVVWDADSRPFSVTSQAKDAANALKASLKVGVWKGQSQISISCWQVNPQ